MTSSNNSAATNADTDEGTINVQLIKATGLPTMDYGKQQNPYVKIKFKGHETKTDTIYGGGQSPEWTISDNRDLELYWDQSKHEDLSQINVVVEVINESNEGDELIGIGMVNIANIVKNYVTKPTEYTVRLQESIDGNAKRGEVRLNFSIGPPIRKAFRAAQRAGKLFEIRDSFVGSLCTTKNMLFRQVWKITAHPREYIAQHKTIFLAFAVLTLICLLGLIALAVIIAVPIGFTAIFTMPLWILPALLCSLATAPFWAPILGGSVLFLFLCLSSFLGLALTSQPVRKRGKLLTKKLKDTDIGKRVIYKQN